MSRPIDGDVLYQVEKLLDTNIVRQDKVAHELLEQVLYDIQHFPTLTPPNEPLTIEQLREMDGEPVYLVAQRYGISEWNILNGMDEIVLAYDEPVVGMKAVIPGIKFINRRVLGVGSYGEDWFAYRRPPEGEA